MAPLPPTYRTFIQPETLPKRERYPAPEGVSLVTSPIYTKFVVFVEEHGDNNALIPVKELEKAIAKVLSTFYLFAGRLSPEPRGRFSVQDFHKGALFQVCESPDSFQNYKESYFGYATVPIPDMVPIHYYASLDTPLVGIQLTQLQGGQTLGFSFNHRISDGMAATAFTYALSYALRNCLPSFDLYYDWERPPLKPNPKYDPSVDYPVVSEFPEREVWDAPSEKRLFAISDSKAAELKRRIEQEIPPGSTTKISVRDALAAFMYRAIVKARRIKGRCDLLYVVGSRHSHPDKRMRLYVGNYLTTVTVPGKHDELMCRPAYAAALRIRNEVSKVDHGSMDALEQYLNSVQDPTLVHPPVHRMTRGCVGWSDWSRFGDTTDWGYGKMRATRSWVDPSPMALVTVLVKPADVFDVVVQLDSESMQRLLADEEVKYYTLGAF